MHVEESTVQDADGLLHDQERYLRLQQPGLHLVLRLTGIRPQRLLQHAAELP